MARLLQSAVPSQSTASMLQCFNVALLYCYVAMLRRMVAGMADNTLTARDVTAMLDLAGVDYSGLDITEDDAVWTGLDGGNPRTSVIIRGPKEARDQVWPALEGGGLACAPYGDRDEWTRR
jgi:hypothetical protein